VKDWNKITFFKREEFVCKCGCGLEIMRPSFIEFLDEMRAKMGFPIVITSGFRCKKNNKKHGGKPTSSHLFGDAADIRCLHSLTRAKIIKFAFDNSERIRIGIANTFLHIDQSPELPEPRIWIYGKKIGRPDNTIIKVWAGGEIC